jgi:hypothetical protein
MFKKIPEEMHPQVNLILHNMFVLSVETVARFESTYLVFRGREGGTSDDGRAFFVPYDEISFIRIERETRLGELKRMYGETGYVDAEDRLNATSPPAPAQANPAKPSIEVQTPAPAASTSNNDPASIAKANLLERIRAARAGTTGMTGKLAGGK